MDRPASRAGLGATAARPSSGQARGGMVPPGGPAMRPPTGMGGMGMTMGGGPPRPGTPGSGMNAAVQARQRSCSSLLFLPPSCLMRPCRP